MPHRAARQRTARDRTTLDAPQPAEPPMEDPREHDLPLPRAATPAECMRAAAAAVERACASVLATVLSRKGSAPATPGQKLLLCADGLCLGTVGGGALERSVLEAMRDALRSSTKNEAAIGGILPKKRGRHRNEERPEEFIGQKRRRFAIKKVTQIKTKKDK